MDVFVLPSLTETFSNAALEAMAMARPVGAARVGGMEEMLQFGGGFTYPPGDLKLLCDHLAGLFGNERELALLGEQARTAVLGHFSWSSMVDNYLRVMVRAPAGAVSAS